MNTTQNPYLPCTIQSVTVSEDVNFAAAMWTSGMITNEEFEWKIVMEVECGALPSTTHVQTIMDVALAIYA